jgi:DNA polymerase III delta' subunit
LAQAYAFTGPPGVGKQTTAVALAQALKCLSPLTAPSGGEGPDACGVCRACTRIAAGQHPDVTLVAPEEKTVITIDQIRGLAARAGLRAYEGAAKVWILDPAHEMQEPAANAFLKTLEEPSAGSLFILVTTGFSALLPTIRSRCQEVRFTALAEHLRTIMGGNGRKPRTAAAAAAAAARARLADAELCAMQRSSRSLERLTPPGPAGSGRAPQRTGKVRRMYEALLAFTRAPQWLTGLVRRSSGGTAAEVAAWPAPPGGVLQVDAAQREAGDVVWHAQASGGSACSSDRDRPSAEEATSCPT